MINNFSNYYFIGIGGAGMSALADGYLKKNLMFRDSIGKQLFYYQAKKYGNSD